MSHPLFRTIVVFGSTLTAGAAVTTLVDGCGGDDGSGPDPIDAAWGFIDAPVVMPDGPPDAWAIIDAPQPDAAPDASTAAPE